jgi:hypothetical protein
MSAAAAVPGLSDLLAWPTEHLTEAADHWEAVELPNQSEPPFPPPRQINGYTGHGRDSVDNRDGHGVNDDALQDAVEHPLSPPSYQIDQQGRGAYLYQGRDATVVLNQDGQVVTAWPNNHRGWRH